MTGAFNPLEIANLARSIVTRLEEMEPVPLDKVPTFQGAGLYAIYCTSDFATYAKLAEANADETLFPIYVGKAVPSGGRRGLIAVEHTKTRVLSQRIRQHAASVRSAQNLDIEGFCVRWLVVEDIWIALGESAMIRRYRPVWNAVVDGFGNHDPGKGRINGKRSVWDTMHPGRNWASNFPARDETADLISNEIRQYLHDRLN